MGSADPEVGFGAHLFRYSRDGLEYENGLELLRPPDPEPAANPGGPGGTAADFAGIMRILQPPVRTVALSRDRVVVSVAAGGAVPAGVQIYQRTDRRGWGIPSVLPLPGPVSEYRDFGAALALYRDNVLVSSPSAAAAYIHQGWLTDDHRYYYLDDELDELVGTTSRTRTYIYDVAELDDPILVGSVDGPNGATDHNLYVKGDRMYQANYQAGFRLFDISDPESPAEIGWFDTTPYGGDPPGFVGAWTAYPFFDSGTVVVTSMYEGVFLPRPQPRRLIPQEPCGSSPARTGRVAGSGLAARTPCGFLPPAAGARGAGRIRTAEWRFCRPLPYPLATAPTRRGRPTTAVAPTIPWIQSGKPDSNRRPPPWQGGALPTELFPRFATVQGQDSESMPPAPIGPRIRGPGVQP